MPMNKKLMRAKPTERRYMKIKEENELRFDTEANTLYGYAAKFDKLSEDLCGFKEKIRQGAFKNTINQGADVRALFNHDPNLILGRTKSQTLRIFEDKTGLGYEIKLPGTTYAQDLKESITRGDISQNSFAFQTIKDEWTHGENQVRELIEVKLFDVSPVTYPAYQDTDLKLRSLFDNIGINYTEMMEIILKANRSGLTDEEKEELRGIIGVLSDFIEPPKEVDEVIHRFDIKALMRAEYNRRKYRG